jgi:transcriptional regulator with XRE-family HTH domain
MNFGELQGRLVDFLRERVRSGEITERSLARTTGVSQPHIHNVLKGKRYLSLETADEILRQIHLDLLDLIEPEDMLERNKRL